MKHETPTEDKAPLPSHGEMGPSIYIYMRPSCSILHDLGAVSGSKSDTPTRAKNLEGMKAEWAEEVKGMTEWWEDGEDSRLRSELRREDAQETQINLLTLFVVKNSEEKSCPWENRFSSTLESP